MILPGFPLWFFCLDKIGIEECLFIEAGRGASHPGQVESSRHAPNAAFPLSPIRDSRKEFNFWPGREYMLGFAKR